MLIDFGPAQLGRPLSPVQVRMVAYAADGMTNAQIASQLHVTINTVQTQMRLIKAKLGAKTHAHVVALAYQRNILTLPNQDSVSQQQRIATVSEWIKTGLAKTWRQSAGVSLTSVALQCKVRSATVVNWETGRVTPSGAHLDDYYQVLNVLRNIPGMSVYAPA